jgi:CubicO group peptidase (beta-lactamase class C family)
LIAAQPQNNDPRAASTYHALTFGWICGELVRRIDGRSIGSFFREEIADPLALEIWIGLPADLEPRVSRVEMSPHWGASPASISANLERDELLRSVFANPRRYEPEHFPWNETSWHVAEVPAANAIATARAVATLYGSLDELLGSATLNLVQERQSATHDSLSGIEIAFGAGFQLQTSRQLFGPVARALGHSGSGGSRHGFWPDERVGFSYAMNLMRDDPEDDRAVALLAALHDGVRGTRR